MVHPAPMGVLLACNILWSTALAGVADALCQTIEEHFLGKVREEVLSDGDSEWDSEDDTRLRDLQGKAGMHDRGLTPRSKAELTVLRARNPKRVPFDWGRFARFSFSFGTLCDIPTFFWYTYILPAMHLSIVPKIAVDNFVFSPIWSLIGVTTYSVVSCGCDCEEVGLRLQKNYLPTYGSSLIIYIPFDIPLFLYVPAHLQPAAVKTVDVFYLTAVSYINNREVHEYVASPEFKMHRRQFGSAMSPLPARMPPPADCAAPEEPPS